MDKMEEEIEKVSELAEMNSAPMDSLEREMEKYEGPIEELSKKIEEHSMAMYKLYPKEAKEAFENFTGEKNGLGIPLPPKPPKAPKPPRLPKAPKPPMPPKAPKPPKPPKVDNRSGYSAPSKIGAIAPELEIAAPIEVESPVAMVEPIVIMAPVALSQNIRTMQLLSHQKHLKENS